MRGRTLVLFAIALLLAGGTAVLMRSWLAQRPVAAAGPALPPRPAEPKSILVARTPIARGQILKPTDYAPRPWPQSEITPAYIVPGSEPAKAVAGSVAREPFVAGEPIVKAKIVAPGDRGFLAAVLQPGMRAVSVPVSATSAVSGFIFPGDRVDLLITLPLPADGPNGGGYQHKAAETVLRDVRVIAIGQQLDGKEGQAILAATATLEVTPKQSEIIALADEIGKLSLTLRSLTDRPGGKAGAEAGRAVAEGGKPGAEGGKPDAEAGKADAADSLSGPRRTSFTLDSEVSQLLPKPFTAKQNHNDGMVTILRGNGASGTSVASQPASRGS